MTLDSANFTEVIKISNFMVTDFLHFTEIIGWRSTIFDKL